MGRRPVYAPRTGTGGTKCDGLAAGAGVWHSPSMGLFGRSRRAGSRSRGTVVVVAFRDLDRRDPLKNFSVDFGYAYIWPFREKAEVGSWAIAPGVDGPATVIVGHVGMPRSAAGIELKSLTRPVPETEVAKAIERRRTVECGWLDMARRSAGLPVAGTLPRSVPSGFDPVPPARGNVDAATAQAYGGIWWRAYRLAEDIARDPAEIEAFGAIARDWYRQARAAEKADTLARVRQRAESIDLRRAIHNVARRSRSDVAGMVFEGIFLADWLRYVEQLTREKREDEALELAEALVTAAEQKAAVDRTEPAPAYTKRVAVMYRKRRDYASEIAVLERWMAACPRGRGNDDLTARLAKARELAAAEGR